MTQPTGITAEKRALPLGLLAIQPFAQDEDVLDLGDHALGEDPMTA